MARESAENTASENTAPESTASESAAPENAAPDSTASEPVVRKQRRAVFRIPLTSLLTIPILLFGITPAAFAVPGLQALYLIPVAIVVWVVRIRTVATPEGLSVRTLTSSREIGWDELSGLSITEKAGVHAALRDGSTAPLPHVRLHHVPVLSLLSNGRVPDPSGALAGDGDEERGDDHDGERAATVGEAAPTP